MDQLKKVEYSELNAKQRELYNFQKVAGVLADYGFNCIKLSDDWQGADFLAYHKDGNDTLKVQLKSRLAIARKYKKKDLFIVFPVNETWYLVEHDELVRIVGMKTSWLRSKSWKEKGGYSSSHPNPSLLEALARFTL